MDANALKRKTPTNEKPNGSAAGHKKKKKKKSQKVQTGVTAVVSQTQSAGTKKVTKKEKGTLAEYANRLFFVPNTLKFEHVEAESHGVVTSNFEEWKNMRTGKEILEDDDLHDSNARGNQLFSWLIAPITIEEFYEKYYEKKPLLIKRNKPSYYDGWFCKEDMDQFFKTSHVEYGKHVDITLYEKGQRKTLNPQGRATAKEVWKFFDQGCSVRMLHPQQYSTPIAKLLSSLEDFWDCGGGCNSYLTPAGQQGFAPHYDDVEAFVIQTEGAKKMEAVLTSVRRPNTPQNELRKFFSERNRKAILGN